VTTRSVLRGWRLETCDWAMGEGGAARSALLCDIRSERSLKSRAVAATSTGLQPVGVKSRAATATSTSRRPPPARQNPPRAQRLQPVWGDLDRRRRRPPPVGGALERGDLHLSEPVGGEIEDGGGDLHQSATSRGSSIGGDGDLHLSGERLSAAPSTSLLSGERLSAATLIGGDVCNQSGATLIGGDGDLHLSGERLSVGTSTSLLSGERLSAATSTSLLSGERLSAATSTCLQPVGGELDRRRRRPPPIGGELERGDLHVGGLKSATAKIA